MELHTKYSIGDRVSVMAERTIEIQCPFCGGIGEKMIHGTKMFCQNCEGGVLTEKTLNREPATGIITSINIFVSSHNEVDEYEMDGYEEVPGMKNAMALVEYYVLLDSPGFDGGGTYHQNKIIGLAEEK